MTHLRLFLIYSIVFLFCTILQTQAQEKFNPRNVRYLWPTDASRFASALFGESRSAHFHAALDVKTWGRIGFKIYATRDGILHRVARGPFGYGNVIYLKHDDGSYSVYAHMDRFTPSLDRLVDSLRWEKRVFVFDENMEAYQIRYKQGQLIGYTGESGAGPPHLHFELRTPTESPFNPLITSISIRDNVPPSFSALAIEPLDASASIQGEKRIFVKNPRRVGKNVDFGTIDVTGQIGLAVDVFDQANEVTNMYAVYELQLKVNDEILFHSKIDSFSYEQSRQMFLDRVYGLLKSQNRGFQRLYKHDGNTLPFYLIAKPEAKLNLPVGVHTFEIIARDFYKNETKAFGKLRVGKPADLAQTSKKAVTSSVVLEESPFPSSFSEWDWQNDWVKPVSNTLQIVRIRTYPFSFDGFEQEIRIENGKNQVVDLRKAGSVLLSTEHESALLHRITPGKRTTIVTPDQLLQVQFGEKAVYDTLSLSVGYYRDSTLNEWLIYVLPEQEPLQQGFELKFLVSDEFRYPEKTAFYQYNARTGKLDYNPTRFKNQQISARLREFGMYRMLADTLGPELSSPKITRKSGGKWTVYVQGKDNLSGIDYYKSRFWVNDEEGILEYDPELDRIVYYHPKFQPKKNNKIVLEVYDAEGNKTVKTFWLSR